MAILFHTFQDESGLSPERSFKGAVDLSIRGMRGGSILVEAKYTGSLLWTRIFGANGNDRDVDKIMIAGDNTVLYRFRAVDVVGSVECFMGDSG